jgi:N-dimethylarginine dimethylaminohydrolase
LPWSIDSETGVLTDVLLCRPDHYQWIETNAVAERTLAAGRRIDTQRLQAEFRELEDALDQAGAKRHYVEPEPHPPYQVYTRDSSQTTPWGPALTQLALAPRRGEIASILRFHGSHDGFWRYCSHGPIEGGDIHIIRPGLLVVGWSGIRTTREEATQFALVRGRGMGDERRFRPVAEGAESA